MFTIVAAPDRFPHKCLSCGGSTEREWFLDFGEDVDTPGPVMNTVYLCNLCLRAAGKEQGFVDQEPLLRRIKELEDELFDAQTKAEGLEQGLDHLFSARYVNPNSPAARQLVAWLEADHDPADATREGDGGPQAGPSHPAEQLGAAAGEGAEPGDGSGLADFLVDVSIDGGAQP